MSSHFLIPALIISFSVFSCGEDCESQCKAVYEKCKLDCADKGCVHQCQPALKKCLNDCDE